MSEPTKIVIEHLRILCDYAYDTGFHELGYDPVKFVEEALTIATARAEAAVIAAAKAWDHYFFDPPSNKNRQMHEDDLHYALMTLRAQEGE